MPEQDGRLSGDRVEVREGAFFIEGAEVTEAEAREAGWTPEQEPALTASGATETADEADPDTSGPPSIEQRLRAAYKEGQGERTKVLALAPGRFNGLAARFGPIDWDLRRVLIRRAERKGESGPEVDLRINSTLMADACQSMLIRPEPGQDYAELHTQIERFRGGAPIRFDSRLADILGMDLIGGESEGDICRLLFGDPGAFESHYISLNGWSIQAFGDDEEDEEVGEDEGGDRPT